MSNFPVFQEIEGEWRSTKTIEILGLRIPAYFTPDPQLLCDYITNFQTKSDDLFVASYPKSGKIFQCLFVKRLEIRDQTGKGPINLCVSLAFNNSVH